MGKRIPLSTFIVVSALFCIVAAGATYGIYAQVIAPSQSSQAAEQTDDEAATDDKNAADTYADSKDDGSADDATSDTEAEADNDKDAAAASDDAQETEPADAANTSEVAQEPEPTHAFSCEYFYIDMPEGAGTLEVNDAGHEEGGFMAYQFGRTSGNGSAGGAMVYVGNEPHTGSTTNLGTTSEGYIISASEAGAGVFQTPDNPYSSGAVLTPL